MKAVIIGSGMAGLGAAQRLREGGVEPVLYDKNTFPGGHTASFRHASGFVFDDGPHVSFTKNRRLQDLLADNVGGAFETLQCRVNNYWRGHWIKHPAQCNLYGLPAELVDTIVAEFAALAEAPSGEIANYADWLRASYGETFSRTFPMEYGRKYHTCGAEEMTTEWLGPRLYRPDLEEVRYGATHDATPDVHYVTHFRYPTEDGFYAYPRPWVEKADLHLGWELTEVEPKARRLRFANGVETGYDALISSVPLPALIPMIAGVPDEVKAAAELLACTRCVTVNVGIDREGVSEHHWTYFYDDDYFFTRLSFPHLFSPRNVPAGTSAIQAECYYSDKYRPLDVTPDECIDRVLADLRRCGLLREDDRILMTEARPIRWANIIFDLDRAAALATVHGFLDEIGIRYAGRYGEWGYLWTDQSFASGERAAERALGG
ncbi:MAG: FAD-dependent oxidoreductase [Acidobacteria bacterium]|nr:FAD-dependent oxidoreductase [Acidobacteriota bacterium]